MGTWNAKISSNDYFKDIYYEFIELFNEKLSIEDISEKLILKNKDSINDPDETNDFWFALAKAQWDCGKLDIKLLEKIEWIINNKNDLDRWKNLGATEKVIIKREIILEDFLYLLKSENIKPKKPKKKIFCNSIFTKGDCLSISLNNNKFGAAIILSDEKNTEYGLNLVLALDYFSDKKLDLKVFDKQNCITQLNFNGKYEPFFIYCYSKMFKKNKFVIEKTGNINVSIDYNKYDGFKSYSTWDSIPLRLNYIYEENPDDVKKDLKVIKLIKNNIFGF